VRRCLVVLSVLGACLGWGAASALALPGFQTPSRNIGCIAGGGELRCDIGQHAGRFPLPRPRSCDLDFGDSLAMRARSRARGVCHGDTALRQGQVVGYGRTWRFGPFTCTVRQAGVTCRNRAGHGWFLSRQRITVS
jgi:hypothetical protein